MAKMSMRGFMLTFQQYMEVCGAKYVYAQRKEEIKMVMKHPQDDDEDLVRATRRQNQPLCASITKDSQLLRLRTELAQCARFLTKYRYDLSPEDQEEDLSATLLGNLQTQSQSEGKR
jgi:hypothetical protein